MLLNCAVCGKEFNYKIRTDRAIPNRPYCSLTCRTDKLRIFWSRVEKTETCWLWRGGLTKAGYGLIRSKMKAELTHRLAWELLRGPIPEGLEVCHNCPGGDNPACVNPAHLFLGTHRENFEDAARKGRLRNKLRGPQVIAIREAYASGNKITRIAAAFGVDRHAISNIVHGKTWARFH